MYSFWHLSFQYISLSVWTKSQRFEDNNLQNVWESIMNYNLVCMFYTSNSSQHLDSSCTTFNDIHFRPVHVILRVLKKKLAYFLQKLFHKSLQSVASYLQNITDGQTLGQMDPCWSIQSVPWYHWCGHHVWQILDMPRKSFSDVVHTFFVTQRDETEFYLTSFACIQESKSVWHESKLPWMVDDAWAVWGENLPPMPKQQSQFYGWLVNIDRSCRSECCTRSSPVRAPLHLFLSTSSSHS